MLARTPTVWLHGTLCTEELKPHMQKYTVYIYLEYHHMKYISDKPECWWKSAEKQSML